MTKRHYRRRSWWRLGVWRCACGKHVGHATEDRLRAFGATLSRNQLGELLNNGPIPDGDTVLLNGYARSLDAILARRQGTPATAWREWSV